MMQMPHVAISRANSSSTQMSNSLLKLDANSGRTNKRIITTHYIYHSIWLVPIQSTTSAPEHFQRRMYEVLQGLEGVVCLIDDIPIYRNTQEEHDKHLTEVLHKIVAAGISYSKPRKM